MLHTVALAGFYETTEGFVFKRIESERFVPTFGVDVKSERDTIRVYEKPPVTIGAVM